MLNSPHPPTTCSPLSTLCCPCQDENQDAERAQHALKERLAQLQHLCLESDRQPAGAGSSGGGGGGAQPGCTAAAGAEGAAAGSGRQAELLERLSCTLRALGPANASPLVSPAAAGLPPAVAPAKVWAEVLRDILQVMLKCV